MKKNWLILVAAIALSLALIAVWVKQTIDKICVNISFGEIDTSSLNFSWNNTLSTTIDSTIKILFLNKSDLSLKFKVHLVEVYHDFSLIARINEEQNILVMSNSVSQIELPVVLNIKPSSVQSLIAYFGNQDLEIQYLVRLSFWGIPFNVNRTRTINKTETQIQCT
tara:strand:+ start:7527 stop:8024 length:498 start_codon:yes stop_codon:yes gene_type:complete